MSDSSTFRLPIPDPTALTTEQLRRELGGLKELFDVRFDSMSQLQNEKFASLQIQFHELELRRTQEAISAAAAITKSEINVAKQIDNIAGLISSLSKTTDDKIAVINGRLDRGEGAARGSSDSWGGIGTIASLVLLSISVLVATLTYATHTSPVASQPTIVSPAVIPVQPAK